MKGKFRTYKLLAPLSLLYRSVMSVRNILYDKGMLSVRSFGIPVISVGNITVGGTGKTPHVQYLAELLGAGAGLAVLSRGYGRLTSGFRLVGKDSTAAETGDEPLQTSARFPDMTVAVDEDRVHGIGILSDRGISTVILDDAFQHRSVRPSLNILLVDWSRNILDDMVLPAGRMRESACGRKRADVIVFTKCPAGLTGHEMDKAAAEITTRPNQKVFFTSLKYDSLRPMIPGTDFPVNPPVLAVTGIARPQPMTDYLKSLSDHVGLLQFPDHHRFGKADIKRIIADADGMGSGTIIVTTEKDESRLKDMNLSEELKKRIFMLPVSVSFIRDRRLFDSLVLNHVESFNH